MSERIRHRKATTHLSSMLLDAAQSAKRAVRIADKSRASSACKHQHNIVKLSELYKNNKVVELRSAALHLIQLILLR